MTRSRRAGHARKNSSGLEGPYTCCNCGRYVPAEALGTRHRNHCPHCLWSAHFDLRPGDRRSLCHGAMAPIALWARDDGEIVLIHRCTRCGALDSNRVAGDDSTRELRALGGRLAFHLHMLVEGGDHAPAE